MELFRTLKAISGYRISDGIYPRPLLRLEHLAVLTKKVCGYKFGAKHGYKPTTNNEIYQEESRPSTEAHHTKLNQLELELDKILLEQGIQL